MRLDVLLSGLHVLNSPSTTGVDITAISYHSGRLRPGALFVAIAGAHVDGRDFIPDALARGAAAIVSEEATLLPSLVPCIQVPDARRALAHLSAAFFSHPSEQLCLTGVTGTDGKTSAAELIGQVLESSGLPTGLMTSVTLRAGGHETPNLTRQTTLEAPELQESLAAMVAAGRRHAVIEVTSHALALHKVEACAFDIAGITNITRDHLDFHGSWEAYVAAKGRLLELLAEPGARAGDRTAILNKDDPGCRSLIPRVPPSVRTLTYGVDSGADVTALLVELTPSGSTFQLCTPWGSLAVHIPLVGRFNVSNALLAACACLVQGVSLDAVARGLGSAVPVAGRMDRVREGQPYEIVVDYAHTPDSLQNVLTILRQTAGSGRLVVVLGSAGERDVEKRPRMGEIAVRIADLTIFTTEDPRYEDPVFIIEQLAEGARAMGKRDGSDFFMVEDRRAAIALALDYAQPGDVVLLAGKGHEQSIIVGNTPVPWNDHTVAAELVRARMA